MWHALSFYAPAFVEKIDFQEKIAQLVGEKKILDKKLEHEHNHVEQLTRAIYNISMENKMLNKKYENTKEKLKIALNSFQKIVSKDCLFLYDCLFYGIVFLNKL